MLVEMLTGNLPSPPRPSASTLVTRRGRVYELPIFLPVYHRRSSLVPIDDWAERFGVEGCIVNAYLLYKDRELRRRFAAGLDLTELLGFDGLKMTDSGAFQGFSGRLYLKNRTIVAFQDSLGADIISPLDLVTPPGENRTRALAKLEETHRRTREAFALAQRSILAGVQQGGRFLDLRRRSLEELLELEVEYLALGSLVPFFNRNHDLGFVGQVIRQARTLAGPSRPIHVYGAGDPVELPFLYALGANVFDSASYGHYAQGGWYMTPYGALREAGPLEAAEFSCRCPFCAEADRLTDVFADAEVLTRHNLWTLLETLRHLRSLGPGRELDRHLTHVLERHQSWFPDSRLAQSWGTLGE